MIFLIYESRVTTSVHWALNQQTTSTLVHLHTDLPTLHCTIIFLCLSLSCLLCSVSDSCSDIQVIIRNESHAGSVQDSDGPLCRQESWALDIVMTTLGVGEKKQKQFSSSARSPGTTTNWNLSVMNLQLKGRKSENILLCNFPAAIRKGVQPC